MTDEKQKQTSDSFSYKWAKRDTYESEIVKAKNYAWLLNRYFGSEEERESFLDGSRGKGILDAGCGSGFSAALLFGTHLNRMKYIGVDISDAVDVAKERFGEMGIKGDFYQADIATIQPEEKFDIVFSEGVIHHTSRPFETFRNLVFSLKDGGIIMFYVYRKKAPVREFADDFIRNKLKELTDDEAWKELMPLTKLGKAIGDLNVEVELDEEIGVLDIPRGDIICRGFCTGSSSRCIMMKNFPWTR
jgi:SAM-dependent methyltransferase